MAENKVAHPCGTRLDEVSGRQSWDDYSDLMQALKGIYTPTGSVHWRSLYPHLPKAVQVSLVWQSKLHHASFFTVCLEYQPVLFHNVGG